MSHLPLSGVHLLTDLTPGFDMAILNHLDSCVEPL